MPDAAGWTAGGGWSWPRVRPVLGAALAICVPVPLAFLTARRLAAMLGVTTYALSQQPVAETGAIGAVTLVAAGVLAAIAGPWSLAATLTAAAVHAALLGPTTLALLALDGSPLRWLGAGAGIALGAVAAASRYRVSLAAALSAVTATGLLVVAEATSGRPEELADYHSTLPAVLILLVVTASATALTGTVAPVLAPRGALPAVLGPLTAVLAGGALQTVSVTYAHDLPRSSLRSPMHHLGTSAILMLVAAAGAAGLGLAQYLAARRAERRHSEQIRREAAEAERGRLARPIHDGVLQVLALIQRHGTELGAQGGRLAALAGEQEVALRVLLADEARAPDGGDDLGAALTALASPRVDVSAPAGPVPLPAGTVAEVTAAVWAALDNVYRHAGPDARAWVLLEDERDGVRVSVRDDGVGFAPPRLAEAAAAGRLGVAQSMRGRIADCGGTTTIHSRPGSGTEMEFWVPRLS